MKAGDIVTLPTMLAGRDDRRFDNAAVVDIDRKTIPHLSFASGPHRCLGMHLARRELHVAMEEWLTAVPQFRTDPADPPQTHALGVYGVDRLKLVWDV
jgi:cytochrome P450